MRSTSATGGTFAPRCRALTRSSAVGCLVPTPTAKPTESRSSMDSMRRSPKQPRGQGSGAADHHLIHDGRKEPRCGPRKVDEDRSSAGETVLAQTVEPRRRTALYARACLYTQ